MQSGKFTLLVTLSLIAALSFTISCKDDKDDDPQPVAENLNPGPCDENISLTETQAIRAAQAADFCKLATSALDWGLVTATFIRANDTEIPVNNQIGIMQNFGPNNTARKGQRMLVMSTGRARTPAQPNSCGSSACNGPGLGSPPTGVPASVPGCPTSMNIYDDVGIKFTLRVPLNATGFSIDHHFFTFDYPELVCSGFADQFVILVDPAPVGAIIKNVALDSLFKPIGVNCAFMPSSNTGLLTGTGFDIWGDAASTGWLRTTVPVTGGTTITVRALIYDMGDGASDSSVLLDNFQWLQGPVFTRTARL
jgi:hypothetical protein